MNRTRRCMYEFFDEAEAAARRGLISMDDAHRIWDRPRKRHLWCRHLSDLRALVELARQRRINEPLYGWYAH
jgi:hypothetical protein